MHSVEPNFVGTHSLFLAAFPQLKLTAIHFLTLQFNSDQDDWNKEKVV